MGIRILVFAIIVFSSILPALGQETFKFTEKPFQQQFFSGIPVCVADFNGDFVDDLLVVDQSKKIWLGINSGKAVFIWLSMDNLEGNIFKKIRFNRLFTTINQNGISTSYFLPILALALLGYGVSVYRNKKKQPDKKKK